MSDPRYGRVNLSLAAILADDAGDPDSLPERVPLNGEAVIRPRLAPGGGEVGRGPAGDDEIQVPLPVPCQVFEGVLTHNGQPHVTLLVPTDAWYWEIAFHDFAIEDTPILVETFAFPVVELTDLQLADNSYLGTNIAPFASQAWAAPSLPAATERAAAQMAEILIDVQAAGLAAAQSATSADGSALAATQSATAAGQSATAATQSATAAGQSATAAGQSATAAAGSAQGARDARDAAEGHATSAADSASSAAGSASAAAGSATDADGHANRAEDAVDSFGLSATSSTLAPGAAATVTVSGEGPAYALAFGVPQGPKGDKGSPGGQEVGWTDEGRPYLLDEAVAEQGDSGWRNLSALLSTNVSVGRLLMRRHGDVVTVVTEGVGVVARGFICSGSWPDGFRPRQPHAVTFSVQGPGMGENPTVMTVQSSGGNATIFSQSSTDWRRGYGEVSFVTPDAWPSTLPGTAV